MKYSRGIGTFILLILLLSGRGFAGESSQPTPLPVPLQGEASSPLVHQTDTNGTVRILGFAEGFQDTADLVIPETIGGRRVTEIAPRAFMGSPSLKSITLPATLTRIGDEAFAFCDGLVEVSLPATLSDLGAGVFRASLFLQKVTLPPSLKNLRQASFANCFNLLEIQFQEGIEAIEKQAFEGCENLGLVQLPASLRDLDETSFDRCRRIRYQISGKNPALKSDSEGALLSRDGKRLILAPAGRRSYTIPEGVEQLGTRALFNAPELERLSLPSSFRIFEWGALDTCPRISYSVSEDNPLLSADSQGSLFDKRREILIAGAGSAETCRVPEGVLSISEYAFFNNRTTRKILLPASLQGVETNSFALCAASFTVAEENPTFFSDQEGGLLDRAGTLYKAPGESSSYTVPEGTLEIADFAFSGCRSMTACRLPASLIRIHPGAFISAPLLSFTVARGNRNYRATEGALLDLGGETLLRGPGNRVYSVPKGVKTIAPYAFTDCLGLASVTLPETVMTIGESAFNNQEEPLMLAMIKFEGEPPASVAPDAFPSLSYTTPIGVFTQKKGNRWSSLLTPEGLWEEAGLYCTPETDPAWFKYRIQTGKVIIEGLNESESPPSFILVPQKIGGRPVTGLAKGAFTHDSLQSIVLPEGVASIEEGAFSGLGLQSVVLPRSLSRIAPDAFRFCGLTVFSVAEGNNTYSSDCAGSLFAENGRILIRGSGGARVLTLPPTVTEIAAKALSGCIGIEELSLPATLSRIAPDAFEACDWLTFRVDRDNPTYDSDPQGALLDGKGKNVVRGPGRTLFHYEIPYGIKSIGPNAFSDCPLTSVSLPATVTALAPHALSPCPNLNTLFFRGKPPKVESQDPICQDLSWGIYPQKYGREWERVIDQDGFWRNLKMEREKTPSLPDSLSDVDREWVNLCLSSFTNQIDEVSFLEGTDEASIGNARLLGVFPDLYFDESKGVYKIGAKTSLSITDIRPRGENLSLRLTLRAIQGYFPAENLLQGVPALESAEKPDGPRSRTFPPYRLEEDSETERSLIFEIQVFGQKKFYRFNILDIK